MYVPPAGQTGIVLDQPSGKKGRRSSQVGVSFVVLLSPAQMSLHISSCIKLKWHLGIFAVIWGAVPMKCKMMKAAAAKHSENIEIFNFRDIRE
jgi:hypothetical protein